MKTLHVDRSTQIIMHIACSFPLLKGKFYSYGYDPDRFHPQDLLAMSKGWSTSEIHLRNFVLTTWNPSWAKQKRCTFDLFEALSIFDETNRQVLLHWLNQPSFPGAYL